MGKPFRKCTRETKVLASARSRMLEVPVPALDEPEPMVPRVQYSALRLMFEMDIS